MAKRKLREIVTFSSLVKKAEELRQRDLAAWKRLMHAGTDQLLPRARVTFSPSIGTFTIASDSSAKGLLSLRGACRKGRWYTRYETHITPTKFPKFVFDTYSPFEFLDGKPLSRRAGATQVVMHSIRGERKPLQWVASRRRGGTGWFNSPAIIDDENGGFGPDAYWTSDAHDDAELSLPYLPLASSSVRDWLASMDAIPQANVSLMKDLGMRCLKAAARLCSKYPHMKLRALPAACEAPSPWHDAPPCWIDNRLWHMPEVLLFWREWTTDFGVPVHVSVSFLVPPHGRPDMDCTKGPAASWTIGHREPLALPYNYLWAKSPGTSWKDWRGRKFSASWAYADLSDTDRKNADMYVNWSQYPDCVRVTRRGSMKTQPRILVRDQPCAMRPEDLEAVLEESALMSSLPVC